jgi:hypothetical protein
MDASDCAVETPVWRRAEPLVVYERAESAVRERVRPVVGGRGAFLFKLRATTGGRGRVGGGCGKRLACFSRGGAMMMTDSEVRGVDMDSASACSASGAGALAGIAKSRKAHVPKATVRTVVIGPVLSRSALDRGDELWITRAIMAVRVVPTRYATLAREIRYASRIGESRWWCCGILRSVKIRAVMRKMAKQMLPRGSQDTAGRTRQLEPKGAFGTATA